MKKWLILVMVAAWLNAEEQRFSILDLPFIDLQKTSKIDLTKHKSDYINKAMTLKREDGKKKVGLNSAHTMYERKLNINAQDEFTKIGLDIIDINTKLFYDGVNPNFEDQAVLSDIVLIGEVIKKEYPFDNKNGYYCSFNKIRVSEVLSDKWSLLKEQEILVGSHVSVDEKGNSSYLLGEPVLNIGNKYLIFASLSRGYYYNVLQDKQTEMLNKVIFDVGMALKYDNDKIQYFDLVNKQNTTKDSQIIIARVKEILKINASYDFFIKEFK